MTPRGAGASEECQVEGEIPFWWGKCRVWWKSWLPDFLAGSFPRASYYTEKFKGSLGIPSAQLSPARSAQAPLTYWWVPTCYLCSAHRASCSSLPALHMSPWRPSSITPKMHPSTHHFLSCKDALSSSYHSVPWNYLTFVLPCLLSSLLTKRKAPRYWNHVNFKAHHNSGA